MAEYSFPWNSVSGDRTYSADDFTRSFGSLFERNGVVVKADGAFGLIPAKNGQNVRVAAGAVWINGVCIVNDSNQQDLHVGRKHMLYPCGCGLAEMGVHPLHFPAILGFCA